jgi:hypothetical protein
MVSEKLNNDLRERLIGQILRHRFAERQSAHVPVRAALAEEFYNLSFTLAERSAMQALPDGWLQKMDGIRVQISGQITSLDFNGDFMRSGWFQMRAESVYRLFTHETRNSVMLTLGSTHPLAIRYDRQAHQMSVIDEEVKTAKNAIRAVVSQASTTGRLLTLWPEVRPFLEKLLGAPPPPPSLPAVRTVELNRMLGLPIEETI